MKLFERIEASLAFLPGSLVLLSLVFLFVTLSGCGKEELKKPTEVGISFKVDDHAENPEGNNAPPGPAVSLELTGGELHVQKVRVVGEREEGENVDFERKKEMELPIEDKELGTKMLFDLPQGTYKELKLRLSLGVDSNVINCSGRRVQHPNNQPSKATPFRLNIEKQRIVECEVDPKKGKDHVKLQKGNARTIRVMVRPGKWFQGMGYGLWNQADLVNDGGKDLLPIDKEKNQQMHSKVLQKIENAFNSSIL